MDGFDILTGKKMHKRLPNTAPTDGCKIQNKEMITILTKCEGTCENGIEFLKTMKYFLNQTVPYWKSIS